MKNISMDLSRTREALEEEQIQSLLLWLKIFQPECQSLSELSNGLILSDLMKKIGPEYIKTENLQRDDTESDNWALKSSNLRILTRSIDSFYHDRLSRSCDILTGLDISAISKENSVAEIARLVEYVLGCAVQCDQKSDYIHPIMSMDEGSQHCLMHIIEDLMNRFPPTSPQVKSPMNTPHKADKPNLEIEHLNKDEQQESNRALREAWERLEAITIERDTLDQEKKALEVELNDMKQLQLASTSKDNESKDREKKLLMEELNDISKELEDLRNSKEAGERAFEKEKNSYEVSIQQMRDELDILNQKAKDFQKLEVTVKKYKAKLEEANEFKNSMKELEVQNENYLKKILDHESSLKIIPTLRATIEKYKDQVVDLETVNVEAVADIKVKDSKISHLQEELESTTRGKEFIEEQLDVLRNEIEEMKSQNDYFDSPNGGTLNDSILTMREKIARLERENEVLKSSTGEENRTARVSILEDELDDLKRVKVNLEESSMNLKQKNQDLTSKIQKLEDQLNHQIVGATGAISSTQVKKLTDELEKVRGEKEVFATQINHLNKKLEASDSTEVLRTTIDELTRRLKAKESEINQQASDKEKLENYTRNTLSQLQTKFQVHSVSLQNQVQEGEEKIKMLQEMLREQKETHQIEQNLIMSAFHEIGCEVQRRSMMHHTTSALPTNSSLSKLRSEEIAKRNMFKL